MYNYEDYKGVRNKTWEVLIESGVGGLPVKVAQIAGVLGIGLMSIEKGREIVEFCKLPAEMTELGAFSVYTDKWNILYNGNADRNTVRFLTAREIGHIVLRHEPKSLKVGCFTAYYFDGSGIKDGYAVEADVFAAGLLSPACVLWKYNIAEPDDIEKMCGLPREQALLRSGRMKKLIQRGSFLRHDLEKKVYEQFIRES